MPTLNSGTSIPVSLPIGQVIRVAVGGEGIATVGNGESSTDIGATPVTIGPFARTVNVLLTATSAITYTVVDPSVATGGTASSTPLGPFTDAAALQTASPAGTVGRVASVGATAPYALYDDNGSAWAARANSGFARNARRLLEMARQGALPVAMASPPTVTVNATSALTGPTYAFTDGAFQYLGSVYTATGTVASLAQAGHVDYNSYRMGPTMDVWFNTDAPTIEIPTYDTGNQYRIFVDDQAVSLTPAALTSAYSAKFISIAFGSSAIRRVRIETTFLGVFGGVKVPNNYSVWRAGIDSLRGMIVGDSFTNGNYGDGTSFPQLGLGRQVGFRLGVPDWFVSAAAGEGYLSNGSGSGKTLRGRAATDIIAYKPDWVIVFEGGNDVGKTSSLIQAEVTTLYGQLLAALPSTIFTVCGPNRAPNLNPSQAISDAIKAGVLAQPEAGGRIQFFDTYAEAWQSTGAGRVGATSGVGNSNIYIGADSIHPIQAGHDYLAKRIADAAVRHLTAITAAS